MHSLKRFSTTFFEVAPAVEIDASEYRRLA
jgi:hypothetical protein